MIKNNKITPLPWATNCAANIWGDLDNPAHDGDSPLLFIPHRTDPEIPTSTQQANADFIVEAVNSYASLRSTVAQQREMIKGLCKSLVDCLSALDDLDALDWGEDGKPFNWDLISEIGEDVLAKAMQEAEIDFAGEK